LRCPGRRPRVVRWQGVDTPGEPLGTASGKRRLPANAVARRSRRHCATDTHARRPCGDAARRRPAGGPLLPAALRSPDTAGWRCSPAPLPSSGTNERRHRRTRSRRAWTGGAQGLCYDRAARICGLHFERRSEKMPNIKQQEKRVRIAARQRLENLRYRSTIKTLVRRLQAAVADGNAETVAAEERALVRMIDKAAARGAIHRNTAARRKAQAARIASGASSPG